MKAKIMFINAIDEREMSEEPQPLALAYLAASLREAFGEESFKFKILDHNIKSEIENFKPDMIGISSTSKNYNVAKRYAEYAKLHDIPIIIGGVHISSLPQTLTKDMDVGVISEGEKTIVELFENFEKNGMDFKDLENTNGLIYREDGKIHLTNPREFIEPLDTIPLPARDLLQLEDQAFLFSSRGCPYNCRFCFSTRFWKKVRFFSVDYVMNELNELVEKYKVKEITFYDDLFVADKERLKMIVEKIKKSGMDEKVKFKCNCRANLVDDRTARLLKAMNVYRVGIGFESGSQRILTWLKGENITVEDNENAIRLLNKYKIPIIGAFMFGSPDETREEILETLNFVKKYMNDSFNIQILTPLPGTPVWDYAKERGFVSDDMDWERLSMDSLDKENTNRIILSEKLSFEEMHELEMKFKNVQKWLGIKSLVTHPLEYLRTKIERSKKVFRG